MNRAALIRSCELLVVVMAHDRRVLLHRESGDSRWWPLRFAVAPGESFLAALQEVRRRDPALGAGLVGPVVARLRREAVVEGRPVCQEFRLFIVKLSPAIGLAGVEGGVWWPVERLTGLKSSTFPLELGVLLEGYVGGWIPDGVITLDG
ncbi:hypothetical protein AB0C76_10690 [Kitasatospora sp. NPDC048722]|uniref:hypothetical protein n=1 Tax=Kitasatospora sp. NPDC048722 TaxID=3155639 RepID=UPI00340B07EC